MFIVSTNISFTEIFLRLLFCTNEWGYQKTHINNFSKYCGDTRTFFRFWGWYVKKDFLNMREKRGQWDQKEDGVLWNKGRLTTLNVSILSKPMAKFILEILPILYHWYTHISSVSISHILKLLELKDHISDKKNGYKLVLHYGEESSILSTLKFVNIFCFITPIPLYAKFLVL